jgi:hypothetical protein|tara:strand:+ start:361 stop:573 length:213 start_codon:yes stop_codon:yes gene_type:complete
MGRVFGGAKPAPAPTVTPNPVVTPKAAVQIGDNIDGEKKKATVKRGVPRRLSSSVLGSVAGETTKAKLGD